MIPVAEGSQCRAGMVLHSMLLLGYVWLLSFKVNSWPKMAAGFQPSVQILASRYKEEMKEATSPSVMVNYSCQPD